MGSIVRVYCIQQYFMYSAGELLVGDGLTGRLGSVRS